MDVLKMTNDELALGLQTWAARVAADASELLRLLGEFDAREAWAESGALSCSHWIELAREGSTAAQLEKVLRGVSQARGDRAAVDKPAAKVAWDDDGTLVLTLRISPAEAPGVLAALDSAQTGEQDDRDTRLAALGAELAEQLPLAASAEAPASPDRHADVVAPPYAVPYEFLDPPAPRLSRPIGSFEKPTEADEALLEAYWVERRARQAKRDACLIRCWAGGAPRAASCSRHRPSSRS